ncbi:MAG: isochorismatase family protein [Phycisphaerae bacterium]
MVDLAKSDVFVDYCVQWDYLAAERVGCAVNSRDVLPNLRSLMEHASWAGTPVISCVDLRRANEVDQDLHLARRYLDLSAEKPKFSLLRDRVMVENDNCLGLQLDLLATRQQAVFAKYHRDPFTNPKLDRLLTEMPARRFVVFGAALEVSLRMLVLGLLRRSRRVALIEDACAYGREDEAQLVLRQLAVKGCEMLATGAVLQAAVQRRSSVRVRATRRSVA